MHWKWDIQQFSFQLEHIPGEENIPADAFSRLCTVMLTSSTDKMSNDYVENSNESSPFLLAIINSSKLGTSKPWTRAERPIDNDVHTLISEVHGWGYRDPKGNITPGMYGHPGLDRTLDLLKNKIPRDQWWSSMRADVRKFVLNRSTC